MTKTTSPSLARGLSRKHSSRPEALATAFAALLALVAVGLFVKGVSSAWRSDGRGGTAPGITAAGAGPLGRGDIDMRDREAEYRCFRRGAYPNERLAGLDRPSWFRHSPYPPYALPLFAIFFEPGGVVQGRVLVELLSLAAVAVMGWYGSRALRFAGRGAACVGAVAGAAIMGNSTALELGQFSVVCMGLVAGQMIFLERGRPVAAGLCWALAMIKPQIGLAFLPLFVVNRGWSGLLSGCSALGLLVLFCCWWTDVPPTVAVAQWFHGLAWVFATPGQGVGPGALAAWLNTDRLVVHTALMVVGGGVLVALAGLVLRLSAVAGGRTVPLLPLAGVCAVLGEVFVYHFHYDNVMLWPTLLAMLALAASVPAWWSAALATALAATLWMPHRIITQVPFNGAIRAAVWLAAAAVLTAFIIDGRAARWLRGPRREAVSAAGGEPVSA